MNWDNNAYVPTPATLVLSNVKGFFPKEFEQGNYYYGPVVAMTQAGELFLLGDDPNNFTATKISGVPQVSEVKVSQGWPKTTFVALTTGKEVYTWEWDRGTKALTTATKVSGLSNNTTTIQIGDNWGNNLHVLALKEDGMLCGWGDNSVGQLGAQNPNPVPITAPVCFEDLIVSSSTKLVIDAPVSMCAGSTFNVTIRAEKEDTQVIDGIQLALKFDKSKLKVNSVTNSGVLDYEMANTFDNATGDIGFMAGIWENAAPTSSFDVFTINFTALSSTAGTTLLDFLDDNIMLTSGEEALNIMATDNTLTFNQCLDYQVNLQRAKPKPDASWKTDLKVSVGSITNAQEYPTTSDTSGKGTLTLANPIVAGDYMCVKNSHTLAN
jgi:hypothetical protein